MPPPPRDAWLAQLSADLERRREQHLLRQLRPVDSAAGPELVINGQTFLQFASNNYLGLATHPDVIAAAREATDRYGTGSGASRLVSGSMVLHHELERALAAFKRTEAALLFPTGFMANLAALTTFADKRDLVLSDKLNHASLLDAARFSGAFHRTFPHRNYERAAELLSRERSPITSTADEPAPRPARRFLVTDSVFSMDGDLADLPALCDLAEKQDALVIIDEAHGAGVLGPRGAGLAEQQHVEHRVALTIGTLSKALGSVGGYITGPRAAIDALINAARSFIYTTALPPACSAAALAALHIIQSEPERRERLLRLAAHTKTELQRMGYDYGDSQSPIIPVILGDSARTLAAAAFLHDRGIYIPAIRPPTVAPNSARLRLSLMATHTDNQIDRLLTALRELRSHLSFEPPRQ